MVELPVLLFLAELPPFKVLVCQQVFLPSRLYRRLKGQHQHLCPPHPPGQLIGGECLAKTHLGIPKEVWRQSFVVWILPESLEIRSRFLYGSLLLGSHREIIDTLRHGVASLHRSTDSLLHIPHIAAEPLAKRIGKLRLPQIVMHSAHTFIHEVCAVRTHGATLQYYILLQIQFMSLFLYAHVPRS